MNKNKTFVAWAVVVVIVLVLIAAWQMGYFGSSTSMYPAGTTTGTTGATGGSAAAPVSPTGINGQSFRYSAYDANLIPLSESYSLSFSGGKMSGLICNSFSGPYTAVNYTISAKLLSTMKACTSPKDVMAAEQIFQKVMSAPAAYTYANGKLTITGSGHSVTFTN